MKMIVGSRLAVRVSYHYTRTPTQGRPNGKPSAPLWAAATITVGQPAAYGYQPHLGQPSPDPFGYYAILDNLLATGTRNITVWGNGDINVATLLVVAFSNNTGHPQYQQALKFTGGKYGGAAMDATVHGSGRNVNK